MTNNKLTDLRSLILCEISDFFAGFSCPGEPESPEEMQRELTMRVGRILNDHIVNYPRCEVLVETLKECRIARDAAQAELQERRKADSAEPILFCMAVGGRLDPESASLSREVVAGWVAEWNDADIDFKYELVELCTTPQSAPVVPEECPAELSDQIVDICDGIIVGDVAAQMIWDACRAAMLQAGNPPVVPEGQNKCQCTDCLAASILVGDRNVDD